MSIEFHPCQLAASRHVSEIVPKLAARSVLMRRGATRFFGGAVALAGLVVGAVAFPAAEAALGAALAGAAAGCCWPAGCAAGAPPRRHF